MDPSSFINVFRLVLVNVIFMIAGIFLNSVVIISLRRSSQLRKKLGYFMIYVLSCFDFAVVAFVHPALTASTISCSMGTYEEKNWFSILANVMGQNLAGFFIVSAVDNECRAIFGPKISFFHHTAVSRRRLALFLTFLIIIVVSLSPLLYFHCRKTFGNAFIILLIIFATVHLLELQHVHDR